MHFFRISKSIFANFSFEENKFSKIFDNDFFGFYSVTVDQPEYKNGKMVVDGKGAPKPDSKKRSTERIPLSDKILDYYEANIKPHVPDVLDPDPNKIKIGYEINFSKYFYEYVPLRPSKEVQQEIEALEFGANGERGVSELIKELFA